METELHNSLRSTDLSMPNTNRTLLAKGVILIPMNFLVQASVYGKKSTGFDSEVFT